MPGLRLENDFEMI